MYPIEKTLKDAAAQITPPAAQDILTGVQRGMKKGRRRALREKISGALLTGVAASLMIGIAVFFAVQTGMFREQGPTGQPGYEPPTLASTMPVVYVATATGDYFILTDDVVKQELLEIIYTSRQTPLTEEEIMSFSLSSFRAPFDFVIDDIRYSFESQMRLLIVFDEEGYMSEYYHVSDFERAIEIHIKQRPEYDVPEPEPAQYEYAVDFSVREWCSMSKRIYWVWYSMVDFRIDGYYAEITLEMRALLPSQRLLTLHDTELNMHLTRHPIIQPQVSFSLCVSECSCDTATGAAEVVSSSAGGVVTLLVRHRFDEAPSAGDTLILTLSDSAVRSLSSEYIARGVLDTLISHDAPMMIGETPVAVPLQLNYLPDVRIDIMTPTISNIKIIEGRLHVQTTYNATDLVGSRFLMLECPYGEIIIPSVQLPFVYENGELTFYSRYSPPFHEGGNRFTEQIFEGVDLNRLGEYRLLSHRVQAYTSTQSPQIIIIDLYHLTLR